MSKRNNLRLALVLSVWMIAVLSCSLPELTTTVGPTATPPGLVEMVGEQPTAAGAAPTPAIQNPGGYPQPTPDPDRLLPDIRQEPTQYIVRPNDTLEGIARTYWVSVEMLIEANGIENPGLISPGDVLEVPTPHWQQGNTGLKILPDSEVVYGPSSASFDVQNFIAEQNGFLANYSEDVEGRLASGSEIILRVSQDYSVSPRLLLALLEFSGGWVTQPSASGTSEYPLGYINPAYRGLWKQLAWAANEINRGYYLWRVNGIPAWLLTDGSVLPANPNINAGTAGIQHVLARLLDYQGWLAAAGETGVYRTYAGLFGEPFSQGIEPILPPNLQQPMLLLPFEPGQVWRFTGGPHGAFGGGAAWAALDFAPPGGALGCVQNDAWVVAMADGPVVRSGRGQVIQDLDGDGKEQTGWVLVYLHIETRDRAEEGAYLKAGDPIGHPSCEGGISTGTHVHIARRYNGEWIPADQNLPFDLEGWISSGTGIAYNGYLTKDGTTVQALTGTSPQNQISR